ncbi:MAG: CHC2 zinc finger domain-containing protein [Defluviitaleaceae bacterium]|nr:CHC2 zinc finger domain-containing protein [Defluviitaleaceae bacterium]
MGIAQAFEEIKHHVPLLDVFATYGLQPNRVGYVCCPLHTEKTPSLKLYPASWYCFGCGVGGDAVKLVELMENLTPIDAARHLSETYRLGLFPDKPLTTAEYKKAQEAKKQREHDRGILKNFDEWEQWACNAVAAYLCLMDDWKRNHAPKTPEDEWQPLFCEALQNLDLWEWLYNEVFIYGDFQEKLQFYKFYGKAVSDLAKRFDTGTKTGIA